MTGKINFSKVVNSHIEPLEFDVIILAIGGDASSINKVIDHYGPYLRELASTMLFDEYGNQYKYVDETIRCQLENKLIKSVLNFKLQT